MDDSITWHVQSSNNNAHTLLFSSHSFLLTIRSSLTSLPYVSNSPGRTLRIKWIAPERGTLVPWTQITDTQKYSLPRPLCVLGQYRLGADLARPSSPFLKSFPTPTATSSLSRYEKETSAVVNTRTGADHVDIM